MKHDPISFTKMHALGNDFVIIHAPTKTLALTKQDMIDLGDRHIGIGFDQLLIVEPGTQAEFFCRIYNTDGSEAEQCGNGLRCVARFVREKGLIQSSHFRIATKAGVFPLTIQEDGQVGIIMGVPDIKEPLIDVKIALKEGPLTQPISIILLGNPHAVLKVKSVEAAPVALWGKAIAAHEHFPQGANVGFMQIIDRTHIQLRTFERGVGETLACGSNACAAAVAGIVNGWLDEKVEVAFRYGSLVIEWPGETKPLRMIGPATHVFNGEITL